MYKRLLCLIIITAFTASAWADDILAPPWRGDPQTLRAQWGFDTDGVAPELFSGNPGPLGEPTLEAYLYTGWWAQEKPGEWSVTWGGRTGVWDASELNINMENFDDGKSFKDIWLQVTYYSGTAGAAVAPEGVDIYYDTPPGTGEAWSGYDLTGGTAHAGDGYVSTPPVTELVIGDWTTAVWNLTGIEPNPTWESLWFGGWWLVDNPTTDEWVHMYFDQVVIDTISYPEPATVALLGLGSLALIRRKRR